MDVDGFSPISPIVEWKFTAEPNSTPDESDLEQEMAQDVISYLYRSDIDRGRRVELEKIAEEIDNSDAECESVIERLGLSGEEIGMALKGALERILGDGG